VLVVDIIPLEQILLVDLAVELHTMFLLVLELEENKQEQ
jgi:hypothetical protein